MNVLAAAGRRETESPSHPLYVYILAPLLALGLQSFLALHFQRFGMIDLPLLVTIYFAMSRRHPIAATVTGGAIGIAQDALTSQPLGIFGICKSIIGYLAASLGVRIDTDNHGMRGLLTLGFVFLHSGIYWVLEKRLLAQPYTWNWLHEGIRAVADTVLGMLIFALLDLTKRKEY